MACAFADTRVCRHCCYPSGMNCMSQVILSVFSLRPGSCNRIHICVRPLAEQDKEDVGSFLKDCSAQYSVGLTPRLKTLNTFVISFIILKDLFSIIFCVSCISSMSYDYHVLFCSSLRTPRHHSYAQSKVLLAHLTWQHSIWRIRLGSSRFPRIGRIELDQFESGDQI